MIRGFQWDLARQVERLDWLLAQLPKYSDWGYEELHLHLEDAVDYPSLPGVARRDAYSWRQFEKLVAAADRRGIRVVPIVNLLGHTQYLIKTEAWRDLNECRAADGSPLPKGQVCPCDPRTLEVARLLIADVAPLATAGKIHVGLDESFQLGRHPASRAEIERIGLAGHFACYVTDLHDLVATAGLRTALWADMLVLLPEAIAQIPPGLIAYDWYYHSFRRHPRFELYNFAEYDLVPALRSRGIDYWGCAMNGAFRFEPLPVFGERLANAVSWWRRCQRCGAAGFLVTGWETYRLAMEMTTVVDAAIAGLWLDGDDSDLTTLLERGFARVFGRAHARAAARVALAADEYAFAGYARWEINTAWDGQLQRRGPSRSVREQRFCARAGSQSLPPPLQASLRWRGYLAARDVFVQAAARDAARARRLYRRQRRADLEKLLNGLAAAVEQFEKQWREGHSAARAMWTRTRRGQRAGQNEAILRDDQRQLQAWRRWLATAIRKLEHVETASPVMGRWQLQLLVHNDRPAVQQLVVQQRSPSGEWIDLRARHTIEFRTHAARPRCRLQREWSVPVEDPARPLRLALRGVGELAVSQVALTDGVEVRPNRAWPPAVRRRLGTAAPTAGWPQFRDTATQAVLLLRF